MTSRSLVRVIAVLVLGASGCSQPSIPSGASVVDPEEQHLDNVAQQAIELAASQVDLSLEPPSEFREINEARLARLDGEQIESYSGDRVSGRFPNIDLIDQNGNQLKFYDDLVRDKVVIISFFYTRCTGSCPTTTVRMEQLRDALASEFGSELQLISLTLEPDVDTPEELRAYMDRYRITDDDSLPKWTFACGEFEELERLRFALGVYDLDPEIDADKTEHAAILTFGNDRTNRWAALPVGIGRKYLERTVVRIAGNSYRQRYGDAVLLGRAPHGHLKLDQAGPVDPPAVPGYRAD